MKGILFKGFFILGLFFWGDVISAQKVYTVRKKKTGGFDNTMYNCYLSDHQPWCIV